MIYDGYNMENKRHKYKLSWKVRFIILLIVSSKNNIMDFLINRNFQREVTIAIDTHNF